MNNLNTRTDSEVIQRLNRIEDQLDSIKWSIYFLIGLIGLTAAKSQGWY